MKLMESKKTPFLFLKLTESPTIFLQMLGRVVRIEKRWKTSKNVL